jgi:hypothetical protein
VVFGASSEPSFMSGSAEVRAGGRPPQARSSSPGRARREGCSGWCSSLASSILFDRSARARLRPAGRARPIAAPRPGCSSSGVSYPIEACKRIVLYSVRIQASAVSSAAGSVIEVRCGQPPFRGLKERFDVRLIGGRSGPAVMLRDRHQRHELGGCRQRSYPSRCQTTPPGWGHRDHDRAGARPAEQPLVLQRPGEQ